MRRFREIKIKEIHIILNDEPKLTISESAKNKFDALFADEFDEDSEEINQV